MSRSTVSRSELFAHADAHADELTPRQREVLGLIATGLTNAEIASRLGITLDGAKHHVSEILTRLGFASRTEAAEWWRGRNRLRGRMKRMVTGAGGLFGLKLGIGGATAAGAVAAIAVMAMAASSNQAPAERQVLAAVIEDAGEVPPGEMRTIIRIVDAETSEDRYRSGPGTWFDLALSPDGRHLAALSMAALPRRTGIGSSILSPDGVSLHIITLDGGATVTVPLPDGSLLGIVPMQWSPDSTRLALRGFGVTIVSAEGEMLGGADPVPGSGLSNTYALSWSPDSQHFVAWHGHGLIIAGRDGSIRLSDDPAFDPERPGRYLNPAYGEIRWTAGSHFELRTNGGPTIPREDPVYAIDIGPGEIAWTTIGYDEPVLGTSRNRSADGSATVRLITPLPGASYAGIEHLGSMSHEVTGLGIRIDGEPGEIEVSVNLADLPTIFSTTYDVVVAGG